MHNVYSKKNTLHIYEFNVAQPLQKKGLGKQLLSFIINIGRQKGFLRLTLTTFKHVQWNAPFYASNGFVIMDETLLNNRLQDILKEEHDLGFPDNSRCAMQLLLYRYHTNNPQTKLIMKTAYKTLSKPPIRITFFKK